MFRVNKVKTKLIFQNIDTLIFFSGKKIELFLHG